MIISFVAGKGGVGKTTLATNLASYIAKTKKSRVLIIDLDRQGHSFLSFGKLKTDSKGSSILTLLLDPKTPKDKIIRKINLKDLNIKCKGSLDIIPSESNISLYDLYIKEKKFTSNSLAKIINDIKLFYDYIIIDTSPHLDTLSTLALRISDKIIIPFEPKLFGWDGVNDVLDDINQDTFFNKEKSINKDIYIIANRFSKRSIDDNCYYFEVSKSIKNYNEKSELNKPQAHLLDTKIYSSTFYTKPLARELLPLLLTENTKKISKPTFKIFENFVKEIEL